ncbi:hypothetical protein SAMN05421810_101241 [Amycolatopsis arida]|uniref:Uncharacterized protein n=1 Tax=Amycolatopsis arida TaxID=587909 RepID=A0A1I5KNP3_9PSEU|nr:hypothetical protein [Amycolatopsis arida]TDX97136.1 hypothetical protein CLV69_102239 [Amycolatopsis arida]SFO86699.1 hypothetical protein SAMN05421810_101241 [Amycolatopsis arida]
MPATTDTDRLRRVLNDVDLGGVAGRGEHVQHVRGQSLAEEVDRPRVAVA